MASRFETRGRRPKILEAPKEPPRPKSHWDHVLEEMAWLAKDFEAERKWKLSQAKRVAIRVSKSGLDQASRGEKRLKEEEQRSRRLASNIAKDVRKFWMKIEKLVLYKHQLELEERKKHALDKQLDFLLGQTERYSTMLAENLVDLPPSHEEEPQLPLESRSLKLGNEASDHHNEDGGDHFSNENLTASHLSSSPSQMHYSDEVEHLKGHTQSPSNNEDPEEEFFLSSADYVEDDEETLEADEALITEDERRAELAALRDESDLPLEELLKRYRHNEGSESAENHSENDTEEHEPDFEDNTSKSEAVTKHIGFVEESNEEGVRKTNFQSTREETTNEHHENNELGDESSLSGALLPASDGVQDITPTDQNLKVRSLTSRQRTAIEDTITLDSGNETDDGEYINGALAGEEEDDEGTLLEEEELARKEGNNTTTEIEFLKAESELPIEELLARYKQNECLAEDSDELEDADEPEDVDKLEDADGISEADHYDTNASPSGQLENADNSRGEKPKEFLSITEEKQDREGVKVEAGSPEIIKLQENADIGNSSEVRIADAAAAARLAQPTGNTFSTTKVRTKLPFLLKHSLREYQHIGLDWLVTMYEKRLNGILADEMGLGKTIMTIALLAHLACEKGIWGPHLIVVPTSVMLNWETEFMKWCPAFKVLTYFGSAKERKTKRQGWAKPNYFHVCITTYRLVIQDAKAFKRKKWKYLILDEAHLIKNWKSQRWQTLLNFNSKRRILLTGTPLQNDLMELWSLMHFLMPHLFQSQQEFKDWFSNPISGMVERQEQVNREVVDRLHNVLRPFILRRLKQDVEKQLPKKYEHVICCKLSKRQRNLYEDFIASSETQATLASGNFLGLINVLMQLRKVCNHPDLFEGRPIISSFDMPVLEQKVSSNVCSILNNEPYSAIDLVGMNLVFTQLEFTMNSWEHDLVSDVATPSSLIQEIGNSKDEEMSRFVHRQEPMHRRNIFEEIQHSINEERLKQARARAAAMSWLNSLRCKKKPVYGMDLRKLLTIENLVYDIHKKKNNPASHLDFMPSISDLVLLPTERCQKMLDLIESFVFVIPAARAPPPVFWCSKSEESALSFPGFEDNCSKELSNLLEPLRPVIVRRQLFFPDRRLIQFDCGKLQEMAILLRRLKSEGHRALIFTQMTKMLDVLEAFINLYGYTYVRLDGSTQPEERQILMQRFNTNPKIFLFILSTRSGGVGINLVGADTVIFYDSDWNPAMDQQAQDRCHRIGQTREVHIYRLISERTIEENILKKANQKRALDDLVIQSGGYNTEFFKKLNPMELFSGLGVRTDKGTISSSDPVNHESEHQLSNADVEAALKNAEDEADYMALKKVELEDAADDQEFTEEVVGKLLEDDEYANETEETKNDAKGGAHDEEEQIELKDVCDADVTEVEDPPSCSTAVVPEVDMMGDVQQMVVAAAAAGHASSSIEDHLLPVEKYAMRFLDLWDPIIDKAAVESQVRFEEAEWELDRLEKLKEEQEAEIDEDNEPLFYESWDTEFANETYRQQVEVLAQQQLQAQLEWDLGDEAGGEPEMFEAKKSLKLKLKKKLKKTKFKSLKKNNLATRQDDSCMDEDQPDNLTLDHEDNFENGEISGHTFLQRKRKALKLFEDDMFPKSNSKKSKKNHASGELDLDGNKNAQFMDIDQCGDGDLELALNEFGMGTSKVGGKISIMGIPSKKVSIIKLDKKKKKGNRKSRDRLPPADPWTTSEDAVLCAIVHEYGINWALASDTLYGISSGGFYRGRYRHPIHCRERFGELFLNNISSTNTDSNSEKANSSAKTQLKVTEEHVKRLLDIVQELPDNELLIQRHFAAVLSAGSHVRNGILNIKARNENFTNNICVSFGGHSIPILKLPSHAINVDQAIRSIGHSNRNTELVAAALAESWKQQADEPCEVANLSDQGASVQSPLGEEQRFLAVDRLELSVEFPQISDEPAELPFPKHITVIIDGADTHPEPLDTSGNFVRENACGLNGNQTRSDLETVLDEEAQIWAAGSFSGTTGSISGTNPQVLGKHQPATDLTKPPKPKQPRLLDLNQRLVETDTGTQDSNEADGEVEETEVTMAVDSAALVSELKVHLGSLSDNLSMIPLGEVDDEDFNWLDTFFGPCRPFYDAQIISHHYEACDSDFIVSSDLGNLASIGFEELFR
ncbi:hypothetical protein SUGI_0331380 [Cryptomeria japonica]|uniref:protein PHOTOPERIOD-INDEPENDENT EARLY FLOWERING 1 n=1 Tax=Cryptomeria japonica TaxID=3369 RepID=UPI002408E161|nr:protein PHOTOPERIOD-INDEPENDENT EARLY FLOWERING 1 [Cryptomeria japonica]XP_057823208.2 protein PHOTOPERIOD-INDEPENDENT EARLY FLOWERING 1 [Cryptomeria japonica]XP_057823209.2 protein PHOTOPERIOD-INDEPENDENT EARLY FLOWERING 1 [Cryptomeria japonica]GLJ18606.1 hypothetical protein SUGI_0331380 [Cryptomeria japonica]